MAFLKLKDNYIEFESIKYFRVGASLVSLGSYGKKRIVHPPYLSVQNTLSLPVGIIKKVQEPELFDDSANNHAFGVNFNSQAAFGCSVQVMIERIKHHDLKLLEITMDKEPLANHMNTLPTAIATMKSLGLQARVAHTRFVVVQGQVGETIKNGVQLTAQYNQNGMTVSGFLNSNSTQTFSVTLKPETTFAYGLCRVAKWNAGKTKIIRLEQDAYGVN